MASQWTSGQTPTSYLKDGRVYLEPSAGSFELPRGWADVYAEEHNNLHLAGSDLQKVKEGAGQWDGDYGRIVNLVLPFSNCVAHLGGEGWGKESGSYADVQMRAYLGDWSLKELEQSIFLKGFLEATVISKADISFLEKNYPKTASLPEWHWKVEVKNDSIQKWSRLVLSFVVWYEDYGGTATIEFDTRFIRGKTLTLVFMYAAGSPQQEFIQPLLSSYRYP